MLISCFMPNYTCFSVNGINNGVHYLNVFWYGSNKFLVRIFASVSVNATIIISDTAIPEDEKTYSAHARRVPVFVATVFACSRCIMIETYRYIKAIAVTHKNQ